MVTDGANPEKTGWIERVEILLSSVLSTSDGGVQDMDGAKDRKTGKVIPKPGHKMKNALVVRCGDNTDLQGVQFISYSEVISPL